MRSQFDDSGHKSKKSVDKTSGLLAPLICSKRVLRVLFIYIIILSNERVELRVYDVMAHDTQTLPMISHSKRIVEKKNRAIGKCSGSRYATGDSRYYKSSPSLFLFANVTTCPINIACFSPKTKQLNS